MARVLTLLSLTVAAAATLAWPLSYVWTAALVRDRPPWEVVCWVEWGQVDFSCIELGQTLRPGWHSGLNWTRDRAFDGGGSPRNLWFEWRNLDQTGRVQYRHRVLLVPLWCPVLLTALLPAAATRRRWRRGRRRSAGRCVACGYDLRHTPGRCPECGAMPVGQIPRSPSRR